MGVGTTEPMSFGRHRVRLDSGDHREARMIIRASALILKATGFFFGK
jgi:hypothetical protein